MKPMTAASDARAARSPPNRRRRWSRSSTLVELAQALIASGRWWLVPMVVVLGLASVLLAAVAALEYVAPFVYTIF